MSLRKKLFTVWVFFVTNLKRLFRDKTALFFTLLFPLIFLFVFGGISGRSGNSFNVAVISETDNQFYKDFVTAANKDKVLKIQEDIKTLDDAKERMSRGQLEGTIIFPSNFGTIKDGLPSGQIKVIYKQNNTQAGQAIQALVQGQYFGPVNSGLVQTPTPFVVTAEQLNEKSLSPFDYTFAGLVGFAVLGSGIFGPINIFPELKKQGILRRMHTTPLRPWQYFMSVMLGNAVVGLMSIGIMLLAAIIFFDLKLAGNLIELSLFLAFGITVILGIGLSIGGWAKNERQAAPLANIVVFPMMFLSGTFFPRFLMPEWLQKLSALFPLTPVIEGVRLIATEGKHLTQLGTQLGLMAIWMVVIYAIAFRVFRWE